MIYVKILDIFIGFLVLWSAIEEIEEEVRMTNEKKFVIFHIACHNS